jgi:hypothetical protein
VMTRPDERGDRRAARHPGRAGDEDSHRRDRIRAGSS